MLHTGPLLLATTRLRADRFCGVVPPGLELRVSCAVCALPVDLPHAKFCPEHRSAARRKRLKYPATAQIDDLIRESWRSCGYGKAATLYVQERTGWPKWKVTRRAVELGLSRRQPKEPPWTDAEVRILEKYAWMCPDRIRKKIAIGCGTNRTRTAVVLKRKRLRLLSNLDGYSPTRLAELLGVDFHKVAAWIKKGWMRGESTGIAVNAGEKVFIHHGAARRFVLEHPEEIDLCRVEKLWFMDLVTGGKIGVI